MPKVMFHLKHFLTPPSTENSDFITGENQLVICNGVNPSYKLGYLIKDPGYSQIGSTLTSGESVTGLYNFRQSTTTQKVLATINGLGSGPYSGDLLLKYSTGSSWNNLYVWNNMADTKVEMQSYIGYCFLVGYNSNSGDFLPLTTLTGTTVGTTNTTDMAQGKYIVRYRDRLYVLNCKYSGNLYPYRVYFSDVPVGGTLSWNGSTNFFDVDFSEEITGAGVNWDKMVVFTEFSAYIYDQDTKKKEWDYGCANHRTIKNYGAYMIWASLDNVLVSTGGRPQMIGNDIKELLANSDPNGWTAEVVDEEYNLYIGNTEANGIEYSNCLLTFHFQTGMWRWRELYDQASVLAKVTTNKKSYLWFGTSSGDVMNKWKISDASKTYTDNGNPIRSWFRTKAFDFGDPSIKKCISKLFAYANKAQNLELRWRAVNKSQEALTQFERIGNLNQLINEFQKEISGNFIQIEGKEFSKNESWWFQGLSMIVEAENREIPKQPIQAE